MVPGGGQAVPYLGLRRVYWVRVACGGDGPARCEVSGLGHRLPVTLPVPLATASALIASGVPAVIEGDSGTGHPERRLPLERGA